MKTVVITGSSKGIGRGLAEEFLKRNCRVVICGRNRERLEQARQECEEQFGKDRIVAFPCDVTDFTQVKKLWDQAAHAFKTVDIWINNAGMVNPSLDFHELDPEVIARVVQTNILGLMYGCKVAISGMIAQGQGAVYNFEGMGSNGTVMPGVSVYGTTKRGVRYFTRSLLMELKDTPVIVGSLSPGMVVTDLLMGDLDRMTEKRRKQFESIVNILADRVETVTPYLAERILKNRKHGAKIEWLTRGKVFMRFMTAPLRKRDLSRAG